MSNNHRASSAMFAVVVTACWLLGACGAESSARPAAGAVIQSSAAAAPFAEPRPAADVITEPSGALVAHAARENITAYAGPASSRVVGSFANPNRHGTPLVFQSLAAPGSDLIDGGWIPVLLPVRPNGTIGWIRTDEVELTRNPFRIEVDVDDFMLTVFKDGEIHFRTVVGIGEGDTPTPFGSFYLTDLLRPSDDTGIYGPYAYGLSGFSESLTSFNGGEGVIGIHGTNQPSALGTRVSHGCIRVANTSITEMAAFLPLGTPVVIGNEPDRSDRTRQGAQEVVDAG